MNDNSPEVICPRSPSEQRNRIAAGATIVNDSNVTAPAVMVQPRPPATVCNNRSLNILEDLNRIYEDRLNDIDQQTNGNHELKYLTYKEWVEMLLKLMRDLIDVVQELEYEASSRIDLLEKKLQSESSATCNTTDVGKLRTDVSNLVELIRRALQEGSWNMDGLKFSTIKLDDIFGAKLDFTDISSAQTIILDSPRKMNDNDVKKLNSQILCKNHVIKRLESEKHALFNEAKCKDLLLANYSSRIKELEKSSKYPRCAKKNIPCLQDQTLTGTEEDEDFKAWISELKDCLKEKELQLAEKLKQNECLQTELRLYKTQAMQKDKAIANMRALAYEVADKHDQIILLRDQVNSLEEELKKAHKKVQFKDNVIRELRREIKNATKLEDTPRTPCICTNDRTARSDPENKSFKSVTFDDLDFTQRTEYTMNSAKDKEMAQLGNSVMDEEDRCIQILKDELEELLQYQSGHSAAIEDQKRKMASQQSRLRDLIYKMLNELATNRHKLFFMRTRLSEIVCTNENVSHFSPKQQDSGYVSPEDMETECRIIDTVQYRMNNIKAENDSLREQMKKSNTDMMSRNTSAYDRCCRCGNSEKLLQEVARTLSNMCGREVPGEIIPETSETHEGQLHPICQAMLCLGDELDEKNKSLCQSQEILMAKDCEVKKLQEELCRFEDECNIKNCEIAELQNAVKIHISSIERLERTKKLIENELAGYKRMTENDDYKMLLEAKQKLEVECQNQLTTINNLRQALENAKKSGNPPSGQSPPVICTDLGHDVLSEQLLRMFKESMQSEKMLITLRDENLELKELLVDTECDIRNLERRYLNISQKHCRNEEFQKDYQHLNERSQQLHSKIESRDGEPLYVNCIRHTRSTMEKECQRRLKEQELKYRAVIDDLTNELTTLSNQCQVTQNELNRDELEHFDAAFHELEDQNERLQQTIQNLEQKIVDNEAAMKNSQIETQQLQSQHTITMNVLKEKDAKYRDLTDQFQQLTRSLKSLGTKCDCGASRMIQSVLSKAETVSFYLESKKDNTLALFNEYAAAQISTTSFQVNERVKELEAKICILEKTLEHRDHELHEANARLLRYAQQNGELTTELCMAQDQVFYLQAEDKRLRSVVDRMNHELKELHNGRKERETGLLAEMNRLRKTMDEHAKTMAKANDTIHLLECERRDLQHQTDAANKEIAVVKAEVFKLKECTATHDGIEKSLRSQLMQTQSEMTLLKCDLERYTCLRQDIENLKKHCARLKDANYDLVRKYNDLVEEYNNLEDEYRKLVEIKDQLFAEIENSRSWQNKQKEQDEIIATKFRKFEEHIESLLDDRKKLVMKIGELHRDSILISGELDQFKDLCSGTFRTMSTIKKSDELQENYHKHVQFGKMNCNVPPTDPKS